MGQGPYCDFPQERPQQAEGLQPPPGQQALPLFPVLGRAGPLTGLRFGTVLLSPLPVSVSFLQGVPPDSGLSPLFLGFPLLLFSLSG